MNRFLAVLAIWQLWAIPGSAQAPVPPSTASAQSPSALPGRPFLPRSVALPEACQAPQTRLHPQPAPAPGPIEETLLSFDPDRVEVQWSERRWLLTTGGVVLKEFGKREAEARQAYRLIRELRLNQMGTVGTPNPVMEYWLSDGKAPRGSPPGLRLLTLDVERLRVEPVGGQWSLCDGPRMLFKFGPREEDARRAEAILRKHGFTQLALLGQATPTMLVFLANENGLSRARPHHTASHAKHATRKEADNLDAKARAVLASYPMAGPGVLTPAVPSLRSGARPAAGPRTDFQSGRIGTLPSGRQLGAKPPPPEQAKLATAIPFDGKQAHLKNENGDWQLVVGNRVLARFGGKQYEASEALRLLAHYGLSVQMAVGQPVHFSYFLAVGRPPRGVPLGVAARAFQPDGLVVRQVGERWCICDNGEPLLKFGSDFLEAKNFLELIRKERVNRLCLLGASAEEGMTLLIRGL